MTTTRQVFAYALVALGALWLLIEIGFVPQSLTAALFTWWPLLLLGVGLDLVLPPSKRGPLPVTIYAAAVILLLGLLGVGGATTTDTTFARPLPGSARSMTAELELGSAPTTVDAAKEGMAVEATFEGSTPREVELTGEGHLEFELSRGRTAGFNFARTNWHVGLTPNLPLDLSINAGSGATTLELQELDLTALNLETGSGRTDLTLPGGGRYYEASIRSGSGRLNVNVEPGASLDLSLHSRSGAVDLTIGDGSDLQLTLASRSGAVAIDLPDDAPIRIEVKDDGSGRLRVPGHLQRRSGSGDTGVWESSSYQRGGRVISITVEDAGSGSITFR